MPDRQQSAYHHGLVRQAMFDALSEVVLSEGVSRVSLRALASRIGVSHTAPLYHFGSLRGLFTAFAAEGFAILANRLRELREDDSLALDTGVAYVDFAQDHPAHFEVMFRPDLLLDDDKDLTSARGDALAEITSALDHLEDPNSRSDMAAAVIAGWSMMHGLAVLARSGNLDATDLREMAVGDDLLDLARRAGGMLYGSPPGS